MRRVALAVGVLLVGAVASWPAAAQSTSPARAVPASASAALPALPAPAAAPSGLAVVALGGTMDAAWPLAHAVYGHASLRPPALDEARARVLCGEPAPAGAPPEVRDLADVVSAVKGDDAASRALLGDLARRLGVRALVVVRGDPQHPVARVFLPDAGIFDAASYAPDEGGALAWTGATQSLVRLYGAAPQPAPPATALPSPTSAPPLATHDEPVLAGAPPKRKAFYESGWFWGAIGAAAFAGGAVFFATRDNGASTIHLQMQVPH